MKVSTINHTDFPFAYVHIVCGGITWFSKKKFDFPDCMTSKDVVFENGQHPIGGSDFKCGHCGRHFTHHWINECVVLEPGEAYIPNEIDPKKGVL